MRGELQYGCNDVSALFSCSRCVFSDSLFFSLLLLDLCQEPKLTHFMVYRLNRAAPTGRGKSSVCQMMSVFGEDECDGVVGGTDESGKRRVCEGEATSNLPQRC